MYLFIKEAIRGGAAMMSHRFAKSNIPDLSDYDPEKPNKSLMYLDANNIYGWTTSEYLSTGNLKWLNQLEHFNVASISEDNDTGDVLEVDLGFFMCYCFIFKYVNYCFKYMCCVHLYDLYI